MEETKTQPVFEVGESEFSLLAEIGWKVGVIILYIYIYISSFSLK